MDPTADKTAGKSPLFLKFIFILQVPKYPNRLN